MKITYKKIFYLVIKHCTLDVLFTIVCLSITALLPVFELKVFNFLINQVSAGLTRDMIVITVSYFILSLLLPIKFRILYNFCANRIKYHMDFILAGQALYKISTISVTNIESGEGVNNAYRASQTQSNGNVQIVFFLIELFFLVIQFILVSMSLGITGMLTIVIGIGLAYVMYKMKYKISDMNTHFYWSLQEENRYIDSIYSVFGNRSCACEVRQYGTEDWLYDNYQTRKIQNNQKEYEFTKKIRKLGIKVDYLQILAYIFIILVSYILINTSLITVTWGITCIYAGQKLIGLITQIVDKLNQYMIQRLMVDEYNKLQEKKDEYIESTETLETPIAIKVTDLHYKYVNSNKEALRGVSFQIEAGDKVVLVGANGAGKSTLVRLLLGFDKAHEGEIHFNCLPISKSIESMRENATFMSQRFFRYDLSLRDNIIISDTQYEGKPDKLRDAVRWAEIETIIEKLDDKLDTEMLQGSRLSGGEWQKIALARTRYRNRKIVIMDEPNSAVDAAYELKLYQKIMELGQDNTMIIVSHRLPICQMANKIIVMVEGKVAEIGNHKDLIQIEGGIYKKLFMAQAGLYAGRTRRQYDE